MNAARVVVLLVCGGASAVQAQTPIARGVWSVGGSASVTGLHDDANGQNEFGIELLPQVGYFVVNGLAISGNLRFGLVTRESVGRTVSWGVGPGATYYVKGFGSHFFPYAALRFMVARSHFFPSSDATALARVTSTDHSWQAGLGGAFLFVRNVAATAELFYSRATFKDRIKEPGGDVVQSNTSTLYGLQLGLHVFVY